MPAGHLWPVSAKLAVYLPTCSAEFMPAEGGLKNSPRKLPSRPRATPCASLTLREHSSE